MPEKNEASGKGKSIVKRKRKSANRIGLRARAVSSLILTAIFMSPLAAMAKLPNETYVGSISWSPDGKRLVIGYKKHTAAIVKANTGEVLLELNPDKDIQKPVDKRFSVKADTNMARDNWSPVSWSPDGRYVAVAHYLNVFIFDSKSGKLVKSKISKRAKDFDPERRWNPILPQNGATTNDGWREYKSYVTGLDWSGDGKNLAISDANGVHVVDVESGKELYTYEPLQHRTFVVSWCRDNSKLATISFNFNSGTKSLHIWNAKDGKTIRELKGIKHLAWSPDSKHLAYDKHKGIVIYDPVTDKVRNTITTNDEFPTFFWSPDGKYLAVSDQDEIVKIVDAQTGKTQTSYKTAKGSSFVDIFPSVFAWAPDGKSLAIGMEDFDLEFWKP